jgi:glycerol-3-phosphate dehydrogenase
MYDWVSGKRLLKNSYYINKEKALERFPMLKKESLKGALIYYDGFISKNKISKDFFLLCRPTQ